jgi:integration host factor subunit beta
LCIFAQLSGCTAESAFMQRRDAVRYIVARTGLPARTVRAVMEAFLSFIMEQLAAGNRVDLRGFGAFMVRWRRPRMARNPRTGEPVPLGDRKVPFFKPSPKFLRLFKSQ